SGEHLAAKGRHYVSLGQHGPTVAEGAPIDVVALLADFWPRALRFRGRHPVVVEPLRTELERDCAEAFALADAAGARVRNPARDAANAVRAANFALRWRARGLDPLARGLFAPGEAINVYERRGSSQNGEDGILAEIFRRIGEGDRDFVEF